MNEQNDILERASQGRSAFRVPEAYFDTLEDRVMARVAAETASTPAKRPLWSVLKPALTMAAMFALIFGMGYGVLSLTHTLGRGAGTADGPGYASFAEEMIRPASLLNYYQTETEEEEDAEPDEEDILDYLATSLSLSDLTEIYAQNYQQ